MKKKILVIINKDVNSGPNIIARGITKNSNDQSGFTIDEHILRRQGESLFKSLKRLFNRVKNNKYSILHSHCLFPDIFSSLVAFMFGVKHLSTIHNIPKEDYLLRYGNYKGFIIYMMHIFFLFLLTSKLICISDAVKSSLPVFLRRKSVVIYNFVDEKYFTNLISENINLFYCGHFSKLKDPSFIISNVSVSDGDFKFMLFGDGELLEPCKDLVSNDNRFNFKGRSALNYLSYTREGILIHSSNTEGFCLAVAEALAANMKVLVPNIDVFIEFKDKLKLSNIYIYEKGSSSSFKNELNRALNSEFINQNNIDYLKISRFKNEIFKLYENV